MSKSKIKKPYKPNKTSKKTTLKAPGSQEIAIMTSLLNEGCLTELEALLETWTTRYPSYALGWQALGALFRQQGRSAEELLPIRQRVAKLLPGDADAHLNLGNIQLDLGQLTDAANSYLLALEINPNLDIAHCNLGNILRSLGRLDEAETCQRRALEISPDFAEAYCNLGIVLHNQGRLDEAEVCQRRALDIKPDFIESLNSLGCILHDQNRLEEAEACQYRALKIKPDYIDALINLGNTLQAAGRLDEAEACQRLVLELKPDVIVSLSNLGSILQDQGRLDEAERCLRHALEIKPDFVDALNNLGNTLQDQGRLTEAEDYLRLALEIEPNFSKAHYNLGASLKSQLRLNEAEASYRQALQIKPNFVNAHSNLIFTLDLMNDKDSAALFAERLRWAAAQTAHIHPQQSHSNIPDPERRIRIGYISADFKNHSATIVFGGMLVHFDHSQFEIFAYSNSKGQEDSMTELFKQNVTAWRNIFGLSDEAVAKIINEDQIDILVDLSGHTAGNRLLVFAHKPAPIQITAWGYATGTGMRTMDVFFADPILVPPEDKQYFAEQVRYLPCALGAFFTDDFPDVNTLPALSHGIITFGSFNRLLKISDISYRAWADILLTIPQSRLLLKTAELDDEEVRKRVIEHFTKVGVTADRIVLQGKTTWFEHMKAFNQVDIALDTSPQGGGVTTLASLMMGVPMITLRWSTVVGRVSASILTALGLSDWIAESMDHYVELAVDKAKDLTALATLRQQLRPRLSSSVVGNPVEYARAVEREYRQLWREWCSSADDNNVDKNAAQDIEQPAIENLAVTLEAAESQFLLGNSLLERGQADAAAAHYRRAVELKPDHAEAYCNLGNALLTLGRLDEATANYRQVLKIKPDNAATHFNLANIFMETGRFDRAESTYRRALQINPDFPEAHTNLAYTLKEMGRLKDAETHFRQVVRLKPDSAEAHYNLGIILYALSRLNEAIDCLQRALQIKPDYAEAYNNLGNLMLDSEQIESAQLCYRRALESKPDFAEAHSNLIFSLDLSDTANFSELYSERKKWDEVHAAPLLQNTVFANDRSTTRRLRIGYVSADFRNHSAAKVFGGMLTCFDRSRFDVFAYSNYLDKDDKFTKLFKQNVTVWRNIFGLSDEASAHLIRDDQIDILVDLSGHTAGNRLLVFARKPAPIQITAWGYATGTGMRAMDVFLADPVIVLPEEKHYFTEQVRYLPCSVATFFTDAFPGVKTLPALSDGIITFGSFNRLIKITDKTYRAWADILLAIPQSRLILKTAELNDAALREQVAAHFSKAGIAADRIVMLGKTSWFEHMQVYNQVDIALDSFPQCGGVTTLESLIMGVPVLTLYWPTVIGRVSASIMTTLGLPDWIAESPEHYVEMAINNAKDLAALATLRRQLRSIFTSSIVGDPNAYARTVEHEYRQLWQEWCASAENFSTESIKPQQSVSASPAKMFSSKKSLSVKVPSPAEMNKLINLCAKSYTEAEKQARKMTKRYPQHEFGWKVLGSVLKLIGKSQEALAPMQKAAEVSPHDVEAHYNLGLILLGLGRLKEAEASYRQALQLDSNYALAYSELGRTLIEQGRIDEAEVSLRQALKNKPDFAKAHSGLIFALDLMPNKNTAALQEERQRWDAVHATHLHQHLAFTHIPDPKRRLRIGYVSADLRNHSAAIAFGGMLTRYDRAQFDIFAYSNDKEQNDDKFAALFKKNVTVWRNILGLDDDTVAQLIRDDRIDILIDLSGHSAGNRLLVFARKPAPIQITAWGYAASTGMRAMDVFFTDQVIVPPNERHYFTEQVRYLPSTMSAQFIEQFPDLNALPALSNGSINFGSFNRLAKVSDKSYQTWAEVLLAVPRSRLILKTPELDDPVVRKQVASHFTKAGVTANRIILQGKTSWFEHMQAYHQIDIALDPFPHGGGITALEGLVMGVPVITLRWPTIAGRQSASTMTTLGLTDWIAETQEQYVEIAVKKVRDLTGLAALRQQLRVLFRSSIIGDIDAYTRVAEREYRQLWQEWCASVSDPSYEESQQLITLLSTGNFAEAEKLARTMTERFPRHVFGWKALGLALKMMERFDDAVIPMQKAVALAPDDLETHYNLGLIFFDLFRNEEAFACFRRVLEFEHDIPLIHNNLGDFLRIHGQLDEAVQRFRRALEIKPDYASTHSNLIFTQDLMKGIDARAMLEERLHWNAAHAAHLHRHRKHTNTQNPERRLRVGYVSADYSSSLAPSLFSPMLFDFDRSRFDVFAYSNDKNNSGVTHRIQQEVTGWRNIVGKSDDATAELIMQDKIDILVDLSGHSRDNRLLVFARKPAPIQITAWGYSTGTGMKAMDILFSDPVMIPPEEKKYYVEQVRYLPMYIPYTPPSSVPDVNVLPALSSKFITFGCYSRGERISDETFQLWAQILNETPNSKMILKPGIASQIGVKERMTKHFTHAGIDLDRITLLDHSSWEVHMAAHNQVDIALDPFPQGGGITTMECMMMGIPIVTLRGSTFIGRTGASVLTALNLTDWIAETPEQYAEIARRKALDISSLAELRQQLRNRLISSAIGDVKSYVKIVEQEYRQFWRDWCNGKRRKV